MLPANRAARMTRSATNAPERTTVLRARRRLARTGEVLDYLASQEISPRRGESRGLLPVVQGIFEAGGAEALRAELERVRVEVEQRHPRLCREQPPLRGRAADVEDPRLRGRRKRALEGAHAPAPERRA